MKKLLLVICPLLILAALTACAGPAATTVAPEPTDPPAAEEPAQAEAPAEPAEEVVPAEEEAAPVEEVTDPVTITFWHTYNETSAENEMLTETLIPLFESQHPDIHVESLTVPYDDFMRKLTTAISGGMAPDLIRADIIWVPQLADMGALVALDGAMSDFEDLTANMFPGPLSTNYWQGNYYGLPLDTNTKVWIYNLDMYAQAGIEAPAANVSELMEQCQAIKAANPDAYLFATDGTFAWTILPWIWSMGGDVLSPDLTTASGYLNGPETVAAYELWLQMYQEGCLAPVVLGNGVDVFTGFAQDLYANLDNGPWSYPIIQGQFPDKEIGATLFPAGEAGSINVVGGEDIVLFQQSEYPQQAMEFMRFMVSDEAQLKMAEVGVMPVRADLADSETIQSHPYFGIFMEQLQTSQARPSHPKWTQIDGILTDAGQLILREEMTPQEALDQAAAEIDSLLQ